MKINQLSNKIDFRGATINYQISGSGKNIVLLHGFLEDKSIWDELICKINTPCRTIAIDLPGHGGSTNFSNVHSMSDMADAVKAVLDHHGIEKVVIAGHSMGGYVSLAFAECYPESILGLALINSTPFPDSPEKKINRDRAVEAVKHNVVNFISLSIPLLFAENNRKIYKNQIKELKKKAGHMSISNINAALKGMKDRPSRDHVIINARFPVLIALGIEDTVVDITSLKDLNSHPHIEVIEMQGGHMSFIESLNDLSYHFMHFIEKL